MAAQEFFGGTRVQQNSGLLFLDLDYFLQRNKPRVSGARHHLIGVFGGGGRRGPAAVPCDAMRRQLPQKTRRQGESDEDEGLKKGGLNRTYFLFFAGVGLAGAGALGAGGVTARMGVGGTPVRMATVNRETAVPSLAATVTEVSRVSFNDPSTDTLSSVDCQALIVGSEIFTFAHPAGS